LQIAPSCAHVFVATGGVAQQSDVHAHALSLHVQWRWQPAASVVSQGGEASLHAPPFAHAGAPPIPAAPPEPPVATHAHALAPLGMSTHVHVVSDIPSLDAKLHAVPAVDQHASPLAGCVSGHAAHVGVWQLHELSSHSHGELHASRQVTPLEAHDFPAAAGSAQQLDVHDHAPSEHRHWSAHPIASVSWHASPALVQRAPSPHVDDPAAPPSPPATPAPPPLPAAPPSPESPAAPAIEVSPAAPFGDPDTPTSPATPASLDPATLASPAAPPFVALAPLAPPTLAGRAPSPLFDRRQPARSDKPKKVEKTSARVRMRRKPRKPR
jgi:hypothetical protein